jgi:hypothetical protein
VSTSKKKYDEARCKKDGMASLVSKKAVLQIRDVYTGSDYFHPGSRSKKNPDPIRIKEFNPKKSGMFIPGPDLKSRIPDPGVKKAPDPGYPDTQHCKKDFKLSRRSKSYSIKIFQSTAGFSAY